MRSKDTVEFASFACYSPRGSSSIDLESQKLKGAIKSARPAAIKSMFKYEEHFRNLLKPFLNRNTTLVPIPRSGLRVEGGLWPSLDIANALKENKYCRTVSTCLIRTKPIIKSSSRFSSDDRPLVSDQLKTLKVVPELIETDSITLIDDIITAGRTAFACALKIHAAYPEKNVRVFAVIRTISEGSLEKIVLPCAGIIKGYPSGKTFRKDGKNE